MRPGYLEDNPRKLWRGVREVSDRYQKPCVLGATAEGPADHEKHFTLSELGAWAVFVQRVTI